MEKEVEHVVKLEEIQNKLETGIKYKCGRVGMCKGSEER